MRQRTASQGIERYNETRDTLRSGADHHYRAFATAAAIAELGPATVCDPACGDAAILALAHRMRPFEMAYLSDISVPQMNSLAVDFPHEHRVADITVALTEMPQVDLVVLTETLEHMADPDGLLRLARAKARWAVVSSPRIVEGTSDVNPEHLWQWDEAGYEDMLVAAGWKPLSVSLFHVYPPYYVFQCWSVM